jgi:hypothetical protein
MLICMKRQLTECQRHTHKNFGFGTILCSFFFERVPNLNPREKVQGACGLLPTSVQVGNVVASTGWREDHRSLR